MPIIAPTTDDVKAINGSSLADVAIAPFISAAECIANQVEACMIGKLIPDDCQTSVITFLACHLMSVSGIEDKSRVKSKEKFEGYSVEWAQAQITGQGIMSTGFGYSANGISGGCLQEVDKRQVHIFGFGG